LSLLQNCCSACLNCESSEGMPAVLDIPKYGELKRFCEHDSLHLETEYRYEALVLSISLMPPISSWPVPCMRSDVASLSTERTFKRSLEALEGIITMHNIFEADSCTTGTQWCLSLGLCETWAPGLRVRYLCLHVVSHWIQLQDLQCTSTTV
jgi:hypothetical protein